MTANGDDQVRFGPYSVDLHTHEVRKDSIKMRLVGQPFEILSVLLGRPGELVTREELRARLWAGDTFVDFDHGLNAAVNKLRDVLCDSAENPRYIETLPRRGYRFIGKVERQRGNGLPPEPDQPANPLSSVSSSGISPSDIPVITEPKDSRLWHAYATGAVALLALFLGGTFLLKTVSSHGKNIGTVAKPVRIMPFTGPADTAGEPAFSADGTSIAFYREGSKPEDSGIFLQRIGSSQFRQLTRSEHDCCPAWSPDGRSIAFSRFVDQEPAIYIVPAAGGPEWRLDTKGVAPKIGRVDWSPDGKTIAFSGGASLSLLSLENSDVRRLTTPPPLAQDWGPSFSADGKKILFARSSEMGFPEQIMTMSAAGGDPTVVTTEAARLRGSPRWSSDGRSAIFSSDRGGKPALWRVSVEAREAAVQFNDSGSHPAVSRTGDWLAYQRETRSLTIWRMDLPVHGKPESRVLVPLTSQTDQGPGPQFSPDGKKLAFMSDRSGTMEIWVSDRDGVNPVQLSAVGNAGTPRWSPDSQSIVFDANRRNGAGIYVISLRGGGPRLLIQDEHENRCPSWSQDGKWIYFASSRTRNWQVWKVPADGGSPVQVTKLGGHAALESADGKFVYYAKTPYANPEIWQVPANGGHESLISARVRPPTWASWSVIETGILFAESSGKGAPVLNLFDPASRRIRTMATLDIVPFWLTATRDGKTAAFDKPGWHQAQIMLIENFH
jgi:Tol biopolymer transport system component/DNA-binding winged helix-turn-helix (wHTH) protein